MTEREVDVLVVGGGPAGLSAATALARAGVSRVEVVDREPALGGIPRHSHHSGYGLRDLHRLLTGPGYAASLVERALAAGALLRPGVTITSLDRSVPDVAGAAGGSDSVLWATSRSGRELISARAVVLATGARERPRPARLVPGSRPAGIYTTGQLQQAVHEYRQPIGSRAVVVGAEHVSYSAVTTLAHAGLRVVAMTTEHDRPQTYLAFQVAAAVRYRLDVRCGTRVTGILGRDRVSGVELTDSTGRIEQLECDTVVFTGDWVPDHELARRAGIAIDAGTRGPAVDGGLRTSMAGVFAVGNLIHPVLTADLAALDGRHIVPPVLGALAASLPPPAAVAVALRVAAPLTWLSPNLVGADRVEPPRGRLTLWSSQLVRRPHLTMSQAGRVIHRAGHRRSLVPQRPYEVDAGWLRVVDPAAGPVELTVVSGGG